MQGKPRTDWSLLWSIIKGHAISFLILFGIGLAFGLVGGGIFIASFGQVGAMIFGGLFALLHCQAIQSNLLQPDRTVKGGSPGSVGHALAVYGRFPAVPRQEPFRHLDPITAEHDQHTGRDPRFWRDLDLEAWKQGEGAKWLRRQAEYPWDKRTCKLTPQIGKISMNAYRTKMAPAAA